MDVEILSTTNVGLQRMICSVDLSLNAIFSLSDEELEVQFFSWILSFKLFPIHIRFPFGELKRAMAPDNEPKDSSDNEDDDDDDEDGEDTDNDDEEDDQDDEGSDDDDEEGSDGDDAGANGNGGHDDDSDDEYDGENDDSDDEEEDDEEEDNQPPYKKIK
ncbi:hypothetical protein K7X08_022521 [Anisodus acutangulus]|uniref:Uncharacterized protein n=1 Tax=Anisodus acutangulus TaxID=402998 RepID=A0A9Q1ML05_9SOLA|nr:hypothetical protein K7X08_022521 [Anisodus acutangulus]